MLKRKRVGTFAASVGLALVMVLVGNSGTTLASDRSDQVDKQKAASDRAAKLRASLEDVSADLADSVIALEEAKDAQIKAQNRYDEAARVQASVAREQAPAPDKLEVASAQPNRVEKA